MLRSPSNRRALLPGLALALLWCVGCGTTKWSDSSRTGTEQLLISAAVDRAINEIDFKPMAGKSVYFDTQYLKGVTDENYVTSSLMQHMLSYGMILNDKRDEADYVVVARAGAVGTNRHEMTIGIPSVNMPTVSTLVGVPAGIPEIPFAKSTEQQGVAKLAVFAYNRRTNTAYWQSGLFPIASSVKDTWVLGMGPFQRGTIYNGTRFAGSKLLKPFQKRRDVEDEGGVKPAIPVTAEAVFEERPVVASKPTDAAQASPTPGPGAAPAAEPAPATAVAGGASEKKIAGVVGDPATASPIPTTPPEAASKSATVVPTGHIVRLPPLAQKERPDLVSRAGDAHREREPADDPDAPRRFEPPRETPPTRMTGRETGAKSAGPFGWLNPLRWMGFSSEPERYPETESEDDWSPEPESPNPSRESESDFERDSSQEKSDAPIADSPYSRGEKKGTRAGGNWSPNRRQAG